MPMFCIVSIYRIHFPGIVALQPVATAGGPYPHPRHLTQDSFCTSCKCSGFAARFKGQKLLETFQFHEICSIFLTGLRYGCILKNILIYQCMFTLCLCYYCKYLQMKLRHSRYCSPQRNAGQSTNAPLWDGPQ